jgi:MFS transporter, YQGE family, putative transporter
MLTEFITKETSYFHKLHKDAQKLITTIFLYNLAGPLFNIFIDAFMWRQTHNILLVALYNAISYTIVPFAFYLNGYLLRKYKPSLPYTVSLLISGCAIAILMFLPHLSYPSVILFSIIDGLTLGIYWANRNLLTLKTTTTHDRIYFSSIETASGTVTSVLIPALIGWFIILGTPLRLYTPIQGYQFLLMYMLVIVLRIGYSSKSIHNAEIKIPTLLVKNISMNWKKFRWIQFFYGMENGVANFVPVLVVLIIAGNESALGTVQSVSAIVASLLIYFLGKTLKTRHRMRLIAAGILFTIIGSLFFGALYSAIGVFIFFAAQNLAEQFIWVGGSSINYDLIDIDNRDENQHYAYVSDEEIYLNGGRVAGILLFIFLTMFVTQSFALRFALVILACTQVVLLIVYHSIEKNLKKLPVNSETFETL